MKKSSKGLITLVIFGRVESEASAQRVRYERATNLLRSRGNIAASDQCPGTVSSNILLIPKNSVQISFTDEYTTWQPNSRRGELGARSRRYSYALAMYMKNII